MRRKFGIYLNILLLLMAPAIFAVNPDEILEDPALEARARAISAELRCVVCQGESIDASDASIAHDLRVLLRAKLEEGLSDDEIKDYLRSRYGDFILMKPRFSGSGVALWLAGPLLFLIGLIAVVIFIRRSGNIEEEDFDND